MLKKVGIITGGGDCPGLNTVIDSAVKGLDQDCEILGFYKSFEGILNKDYTLLTRNSTNPYKFQGGTILKSVNNGHFPGMVGTNLVSQIKPEIIEKTIHNYHELGLDGLIVLGGDGSLSVANEFSKLGLKVIGVPKSIDNDLLGTEFTFGFWTAVEIATESLDRLETTAHSHDRVMILEVMGRNAGWIGLYSGMAGGANIILLPEIPFELENISKFLEKRLKPNAIIVVSEGAKIEGKGQIHKNNGGKSSEALLGGIGDEIASYLNKKGFDSRCTRLGHVQRGGTPNSMDRIISRQYGSFAAELFLKEKFGTMVGYENGQFVENNLDKSVAKLKLVDPKGQTVDLARKMGVYFGD
jgi:6-phosphofructokinase